MVTIIGDIGFCFGVDHAIGVLRKAAQENKKVYLTEGYMDVLTLHLSVPYEIAGRRKGSKAAAYDVRRFPVHILRL